LEALERTLPTPSGDTHANDVDSTPVGEEEEVTAAADVSVATEEARAPANTPPRGVLPTIDKSDLAKELEELHATQLRLKIHHELAQATYVQREGSNQFGMGSDRMIFSPPQVQSRHGGGAARHPHAAAARRPPQLPR
jgi:hypothetical protein